MQPPRTPRAALLLAALLAAALALPACNRKPPAALGSPEADNAGSSLKVKHRTTGNAAWYDVPEDSLAARRAGDRELTAAHNRLPLGTLVRVTHIQNGRQVLVRITDRGIRTRRVKIDLCKEAAEELDMISEGIARVRMEILEEQAGGFSFSHGDPPNARDAAAPHR